MNDEYATSLLILNLLQKISVPTDLCPIRASSVESGCLLPEGMYYSVGRGYNLWFMERGRVYGQKHFHNIEDFLFHMFMSITFCMAMTEESSHRRRGEDPRRQIFEIQRSYLAKIRESFLPKHTAYIKRLLSEHPYNDSWEESLKQ